MSINDIEYSRENLHAWFSAPYYLVEERERCAAGRARHARPPGRRRAPTARGGGHDGAWEARHAGTDFSEAVDSRRPRRHRDAREAHQGRGDHGGWLQY